MNDEGVKHSLTAKAAKGVSWLSLALLAEYGLGLITLAILARLLSPTEFGVISLALAFASLAQIFTQNAMALALIRRKEIDNAHINVAFTAVMALSVVLASLMIGFSPWIGNYFHSGKLEYILWAIALLVPLNAASSISQALLSRRGAFQLLALRKFPGLIVGYCLTSIVLAWLGYGAWSLVIGTLVQQTFTAIFCFISAKHSLALKWNRQAFKDLCGYSAGQMVAGWMTYIARNADNFIVGRVLGLTAVGLYGRALRLLNIPIELVSSASYSVVFPMVAGIQDDRERMKQSYLRVMSLLISILAPASVLAIFASKQVILIVLGANWLGAVPAMQVMFAFMCFRACYRHVNLPTQVLGRSATVAVLSSIYAALVIGGCIAGAVIGKSIVWVAAAGGIAVSIHYLVCAWSAKRLVEASWGEFLRLHLPGLCSASALAGALYVTNFAPWLGANAFVDLLTYCIVTAIVLPASYFAAPRIFLGTENLGFISRLADLVPVVGGIISRWLQSVAGPPAHEAQ